MAADRRRFLLIGEDIDELIAGGLQIATSGHGMDRGGKVLWLTVHDPKVLRGRLVAAFPEYTGEVLFVSLHGVATDKEVTAWISSWMQDEDELPAAVFIDGLPWRFRVGFGTRHDFNKVCVSRVADEWQDLAGLWGFRSMLEMPALWLLASGSPHMTDHESQCLMRDIPWILLDGSWNTSHNTHHPGDQQVSQTTLNLPAVLGPDYISEIQDLFE